MRLSLLQRLGFLAIGIVAAVVGGWAYSRSEMTVPGLFALLPALILIAGAIFGMAPNLTFKDTKVEWPRGEEPKPVEAAGGEAIREAITQLKAEIRQDLIRLDTEIEGEHSEVGQLRKDLKALGTRLQDYILAHDSVNDASAAHRLSEMLGAYVRGA